MSAVGIHKHLDAFAKIRREWHVNCLSKG
jgi:hypothetical protein